MINYKAKHGVRILSNDEKLLMFGLVDKEMRDNMNHLKKLVGFKSPTNRNSLKKREVIRMSSVDTS
jgi:hypothetical protein